MINRNVMCNCAKSLFAQDKELKLMTTMLKLWMYRSRNDCQCGFVFAVNLSQHVKKKGRLRGLNGKDF